MMAPGNQPVLRIICIITALLLHAVMAGAFIARTPRDLSPPPEVEIELVAMVTSEATPTEIPEVAAQSMQAEVASEEVDGDDATIVSDRPDEDASMPPTVTEEPDDRSEIDETTPAETEAVTQPTEMIQDKHTESVEALTPQKEIDERRESESVSEIEPPEATPARVAPEHEPVEDQEKREQVVPGSELSSVEQVASISPIDMIDPLVEAPGAPQLAPVPRGQKQLEPAVAKSAKKANPPTQQRKKTKKSRNRRGQKVAGARESKIATREGNSPAKKSGGKEAGAQYRSVVQARLNARKNALGSVTRTGAKGLVVVSFAIGSAGRVTRASVVASSGSSEIDAAARSMVVSTTFPPPPAGFFSARLPILVK